MRKYLLGLCVFAPLVSAAPALTQDATEAEAEGIYCIIDNLSDEEYATLASDAINDEPKRSLSFNAIEESCRTSEGWTEDQLVAARAFAEHAAMLDLVTAALEDMGVPFDKVDTLMRSLPREVALRMGGGEDFTDDDAEILADRMVKADIMLDEEVIGLLTFVVSQALSLNELEENYRQ